MTYLRPSAELTLEELATKVSGPALRWHGSTDKITVKIDGLAENEKAVVRLDDREIPASPDTLAVLATFLEMPAKYVQRMDSEAQQWNLTHQLSRVREDHVIVTYGESTGLTDMVTVARAGRRLTPINIVETIAKVMPDTAEVTSWRFNPDVLSFDVILPEDFHRGVGGDRKEGDITRGGLRIHHDRKHNLTPELQALLWRLRCTNGLEIPDETLKIDGRVSGDDTLLLFEGEARRAVDSLDQHIKAFYDLRSQSLPEDRTGILHRIAREHNLPDRTIAQLEDHLPAEIPENETASHFDLVNLITNLANAPGMINRHGPRRTLQQMGGELVNDHVARCRSCQAKLN